ncbi:MAG: NUDIX domain-containing protein [Candidatus Pacebacteria bacterium]|nr:NUDIX domain-containing protein [Candidatus Paceibacterota bacterium]
MENKKIIKVAVNTFVLKDNKILLGKRKGTVGAGTYCVPGGHLEYAELANEGAIRELKEETGLVAKTMDFVNIANTILSAVDGSHYIHINFLVKAFDGEVKLMEPERCEGWDWFDMDDLPSNLFAPHKYLIEEGLIKGKEFFDFRDLR